MDSPSSLKLFRLRFLLRFHRISTTFKRIRDSGWFSFYRQIGLDQTKSQVAKSTIRYTYKRFTRTAIGLVPKVDIMFSSRSLLLERTDEKGIGLHLK